jgi:hypothetical protein
VPEREAGFLLLATWNIADLGARDQVREPECFALLAEIIRDQAGVRLTSLARDRETRVGSGTGT